MEESTSDSLPFTVQEPEENSYEKLQQKVDRLTLLLKKAKESLLDYGARIKDLEIELKQKDDEELRYKTTIAQLSQYKPPKPENITEVIVRVQVYEDVYCFVNSTKGFFWLNEQGVTGKHVMPEVVDSKNSKKSIGEMVNAAVLEWKEQCGRLSDKLLVHEENNENLKKMVKELNKQNEEMEKELRVFRENNVEKIIQHSFVLYEDITGLLLVDSLDSEKIGVIHKNINAFSNLLAEDYCVKVKEHCTVLLKYLFELSKRLMHARSELKNQDLAWRATCDSLVKEKEELRSQVAKQKSEIIQKANECRLQIENAKMDAEKLVEKLRTEVKEKEDEVSKSINGTYFLMTNDVQVQDRLMNVLSTVLGFSDEESQRLREKKAGKGMFSKFLFNSS